MFGKVIRHCSDVVMPLLWPMGADLVICQLSSLHVLFPLIECLAQDSLCKVIAHYFLSRVFFFFFILQQAHWDLITRREYCVSRRE